MGVDFGSSGIAGEPAGTKRRIRIGFLGATYSHAPGKLAVILGANDFELVGVCEQSAAAQQFAIVFLNFSDQQQSIAIPFPEPGTYREMIDDAARTAPFEVSVTNANQSINVDVPSNYGYIFIN